MKFGIQYNYIYMKIILNGHIKYLNFENLKNNKVILDGPSNLLAPDKSKYIKLQLNCQFEKKCLT
jgi:hypothetical protein